MNAEAKSAFAGFILLLPALTVASLGILNVDFDANAVWVHPVLVMGGLLVAFLLNAYPVVKFGLSEGEGILVGTVAVRLRGCGANLAILALTTVLFLVIAVYLFVENFQARPIG